MAVGPRKAPQATANEALRDRGVAHAVYLERLKAGVGQDVLKFLDDEVIPDLVAKITARLARIEARGYDLQPRQTKQMQDMLAVIEETVDAWSTGLSKDLTERGTEIAAAEVAWQDDLLKKVMPIVWDTVIPATQMLAAALAASPIDGVLLEEIVGRLGGQSKAALERAIRLGIAEGESIDRITSRVRKATDLTRNSAEAVARTSVGHAANMGRQTYYNENSDLIKKVQWIATLDTRTCSSCGALDKKLFDVNTGPRPPRHLACRCTTAPVLKSMKELGLDANDYTATTRASMNGQVAASESYNTWLRKMPSAIQDEALGPARGALFRRGELDVDDFVDRGGDPLTLDKLRKREQAAWAKAGM